MAAQDDKADPRSVIERIRTEDYLLDIDQESDRVRRGAKSLHKKLNSALDLLSKDLYSKKSHFLLELIQNADDNEYAEGVVPHLTLKVSSERLVLLNNEIGFSERNVRALCSVGDSSKAKKTGYIGEKGIGFKSVFTVSNAPEIHSNGFHFRFNRTDESNLLGYVVPEWCAPPTDVPSDRTAIVLPAAQDYEFSKKALEGVDATLLLFLAKLREIHLLHGTEKIAFRRRDRSGWSVLEAEIARAGAEPIVKESQFVRVASDISMEGTPDEKRPGIVTSPVLLAFPVDTGGLADPQPTSQVFAFLPVRPVGFKFAIQADFILSSSREDILTDRPWNIHLRDSIAVAFKSAITHFRASDALAYSYLNYLPSEGEISDPFFRGVSDAIISELADTPCLPSASGDWRCPRELRIAERRFRDLFPSAVAIELFGYDYVDHRVQGGNDLLRRLGAKQISFSDIYAIFKQHGGWLKKQAPEWKARFYAMLADLDLQKLVPGLLALPCIPTNAGEMVVPSQGHVFYPLSRRKRFGFENELVIVDGELLDEAQRISEKIPALFSALQVKTDDPYELVTSHILPRHAGESWKTSEKKALLGHLRYIKDKLREYLDGAAAVGKTELHAFAAVRDGIWVGTKQSGDQWLFSKPQQLYLSKEYGPDFCIESLDSAIPRSALVSEDYLADKAKDPEVEAESWRTFLLRLGVRAAPRIEATANGDRKCSPELQRLLQSPQSSVRRATLECLDRHWRQYAASLNFSVQIGRSTSIRETQFSVSLRSMVAPTKKRASPAISAVFYPTPELKAVFGERLVYIDAVLSEPLLDACKVTYRLDAGACLKRLRQLKEEGGDTTPQLHAIYRHLEQFWDRESSVIKHAFSMDALIRVKGANAVWAKPSDVAWRSNGPFMDSLYPPLQGQYRDFSGFFNDKLGIPRELPTARWVEALSELGRIESVSDRRREALAIYKRANRDLTPKFGRDESPSPDWLDVIEDGAVFLNHRDELVAKDESLFANDAPDMAALFADDPGISFLGVPSDEVPRIERLLNAAEIPRLSSSVRVTLAEASDGHVDANLTDRVRQSIPHLARVLYAKSHDCFESAVSQGLFGRCGGLEVRQVSDLKLSVALAHTTRVTAADIASSDEAVFIRAGIRSVTDQLASELCKLLDAPTELADMFARVLMADTADDADDFLRIRRIGQLPADLFDAVSGRVGSNPQEGESDEEVVADDTEKEEGEVRPHSVSDSGVPRAPEKKVADTADDGRVSGPVGDGPRTPVVSGEGEQTANVGKSGGRVPPATLSPESGGSIISGSPLQGAFQQPAAGGTRGSFTEEAKDEKQTAEASSPTRSDSPSGDGVSLGATGAIRPGRIGGSEASPVGAGSRHGRGKQHRTKAGRLMSYAAGPNATDKNDDADPAKAAARDALGKEAVRYFLATQAARWNSLVEMPHNNPGFDVRATAHDGTEEYIEVKGQSAAWTEDGVALTPTELATAQRHGDRYWLCVVEHVQDDKRRALYLLQNPYGLTQQFRFDSGWKSAAISEAAAPTRPEVGLTVDIPGVGRGRIVSFKKANHFYKLHVMLEDGRQTNKIFNPATMKLSAE